MKKRLFITACLMLLCTFMFGQHWSMNSDVAYPGNMTVFAEIAINNENQTSTDIELAAFCKGVVRGTVKPKYNSNLNKYIAALEIAGDINGEVITFKIFDPAVGTNGKEFYSDYTIEFENDMTIGTIIAPQTINFYDRHWICDSSYDNVMTVVCSIIIDGVEQNRTDLEMAAFYGNEVRGVAKPVYWTGPNIYLTSLVIGGSDGERIDFKVYDPIQGIEIPTEYYVTFVNDAMIGEDAPLSIEFITTPYVAQVGDKKYQSLEAALKALTDGSTLTILEDITISEKWDNRYTGAKVGVPVTIDGNGKTIKFTGEINDAGNYTAAFRFEAAATIKNLKIDMSDATSNYSGRFSAVAAKLDITVDACTFIGNANYDNTKAIIFGESAGFALADVNVSITNSHFENWKYGVSDNQNAQDAKNVKIVQNVFEDASVNVSALESVIFNENKLNEGNVTITSYTNKTALKVEAVENTLDTDETNTIQVNPANVNAQEGFLLPVAEVGGKYYLELDKAFAAAQNDDEVKVLQSGIYALSTSGKNLTITAAVAGVVFDNIGAHGMGGANVTFNNVTFDYYPNVNYTGLQHSGNLVYNNCTFNGQVFLYGNKETFNKCTFNQNSSDAYNVWTYGAEVVAFNECDFNSAGKSVLIYAESATVFNDVTVTGCTFNATAAVDDKAAIEMDSSLTAGINLTISNTTVTGFDEGNVSGNRLWNNKKPIKDQASFDKNNDITVKVDGTIVLEPIVGTITPGYTSTTSVWGEAYSNAKESLVIKIYAGEELLGTTKLNDINNNIINGEKNNVTWHACFDPNDNDEYWTTEWVKLTPEVKPTKVELYIDGYLLATNNVQMNAPGNMNPVVWENIFVAKVGDKYYTTVTKAINAAQSGQIVQLLAREINEAIAPWAGDASHASEKSITILGAENFGTTLTGGLYLGYDDSGCRAHDITIKGIAFEGKGILVAGQQNVVIEGNKFTNITDVVATSQSANANAISVIGKNINATVKNNVIENIAVAGINLRDVANATVEGNTITDTKHNAITITETAGEGGEISVVNNKLSQWGLGKQKGRAIRISANKDVNINGNVMSHTAAPESFVKVTGLGTEEKPLNVDKNYWHGNNPIALFETDGKADPVSYLVGYYEAQPLVEENYVNLSASVAKIGDKYYQTLPAAIAAAEAGQTIELLADITAADVIWIEKSLTINGNGKKVESTANRVFRVNADNIEVTLNNVNMVNTAERVGTNDIRGISIDPGLAGVKLTLNECSVDFTDVSANDWTYAVNVSGNGTGHTVTVNGGTYEGANVINVNGANNTVVVKNTTLNSMYPNNDVYYGACIWVLQNQGSRVEATGNTFNGSNAVAFNLGTGTALTESNNTDNTTICVAKIGDKYYTSLKDAFAAAEDGDTIKVLHNIALAKSITNAKKVTLDLNGKTITGTDNDTASFGLITNKGVLTITGNGKITLKATYDRDWNAYSSVISNQPGGKLIVENGTIEHLGGTDMAYGIDNLTNGKGTYAETVVNGGTVKSTYRAIRQFLNGIEAQNILTVNGGTIEGANKSIWMQDPSAKANSGKLTVGAGASLKGDVYLSVTEGSTEWPVEVSIANAAFETGTVLTGNVPAKYVVENVDGIWGIAKAVASVNGIGYKTIAKAINAAQDGDEVFVYAGNYTLDITLNKAIVLVGERDNENKNLVNITGQVSLSSNATVKNLNVRNDKTNTYSCAMSVSGKNIVIDGVNLSGYNAMRYCYAEGDITIKNSTLTSDNFTIHFDGSNGGNVIIENSDITGWCSYAGSIGTVSYTKCNIDNGNYSGHRYYNKDINFTECIFSEGMMIDLQSKPSNVAFVDEDMTMDEVKSLFKPDHIYNNEVTLNGNKVEYAVSMAGVYYNTLQEAIDALPEGSSSTYFGYLRSNNVLVAPVIVPAGKKINLDLNNFNITYTSEVAGEAMITNNGELTIEGKGNVVYTYNGTPDASYSKGNYTISNSGTLTINGDNTVIENATKAMSHAFYTIQNGNNGTVIINKGQIINTNNYAIRQFASSNNVNTVTINGGKVSGTRAVWIQAAGSNANNKPVISLNVNGGELIGTGESVEYKLAVYSYSYGDSMENISINITNGTIDGDIALTGGENKTNAETVSISGGIFKGDVYSYAADEIAIPAIAITGGTFADDYSELYSKDDGYIFVQNTEGAYNVVLALVEIEGEGYESLQAAIDAATEGATIKVIRDFDLAETATIPAGKVVTLDLAGCTISQVKAQTQAYQMILNDGILTIEDSSDTESGKISYTDSGNGGEYISDVIYNRATLIINGGTIENLSSETVAANGYPHAVDTYSGIRNASVTINGGTIYCAEYSAIRMFCVSSTNEADLTIEGGTVRGAIDMQNGISAAAKGSLTINGGNFETTKNANNIRFANWSGGATEYGIVASVTGGTFNGGITTQYVPAEANFNSKFITGGAFVNNPSDYCAENYGAVYNGEYFIVKLISGTQTREFASAGWHWFSTYINLEGADGLKDLQNALVDENGNCVGKQIKGQDGFTQYFSGYNAWSPGLPAITTAEMYMVNVTAPVTVELTGDFVDYENRYITLTPGWNWIGYPVRETVAIENALAKLNPKDGDIIKPKSGTGSQYYEAAGGWFPSFDLVPGHGYKYLSVNPTTTGFYYTTENNSRGIANDNVIADNRWNPAASEFAENMVVIAMLNINGELADENYEVAAFANGVCRGSARPIYNEKLDKHILFMTINGEEVEELTFKCYNINSDEVFELNDVITYSNDAVLGSLKDPYIFNCSTLGIGENSLNDINIYPNPTTRDRAINLQATCDNVEIFNALGVKVAEYQNVDTIDALETAGVYVIRVTINGEVKNCRLVVE